MEAMTEMGNHTGLRGPTTIPRLTDLRERIRTFVGIAAANGSPISIDELRTLLPPESVSSSNALENFLENDRVLSKDLVTSRGEVAPRGSSTLLGRRRELQSVARNRLRLAKEFAVALRGRCTGIEMIGVSGSTAYDASKDADDIDFFLVTSIGRLWSSLLLSMILAKIQRLRDPEAPVFCFNRVLDIRECTAEFNQSRDPFVAREALSLQVVFGNEVYQALLRGSPWMAEPFPTLYQSRRATTEETNNSYPTPKGESRGLIEFAALAILGPYLWMAGLRRNRWLRKQNRANECFRTVIRKSMCAFESNLYEDLRQAYGRAFS
jgi:hypothetical protein